MKLRAVLIAVAPVVSAVVNELINQLGSAAAPDWKPLVIALLTSGLVAYGIFIRGDGTPPAPAPPA